MQSVPDLPPHPDDAPPQPPGELVVLNGRLSGTRCALAVPLTLVGRAEGCEVRLNLDGISPLHCALVHGPGGLIVRDLTGSEDTLVNESPITTQVLGHGDVIGVGPFRFRIELPDPAPGEGETADPAALEAERQALRIQAAAVAAQQGALTEEEIRLQQQRTALARQEEQLAAHLEERRRRLLELQEQTRQDRQALKEERAAAREEEEELRSTLGRIREEAVLAQKERQRLVELRKRLKRRWHKHWDAQVASLGRREQAVAAQAERLRQDAEALRQERRKLDEAQLRFNGEAELGRRQLREEWQQLGLAQQQWEACLNQEQAERDRRGRALDARAAALAAAEQALAEQQRRGQEAHAKLRKEVEGLEARVRNQRQKLNEQEQQQARLGMAPASFAPPPAVAPVVPAPSERREWPAVFERAAGDLADQRLHLLEQWRRLLALHEQWQQEQGAGLDELETAARQLEQREQRLLVQEQALAAGLADLRARQEALLQMRGSLEGWHARLRAREADWESERAALLVEVQVREETAAVQARRLENLRQRWGRRYRKEVEELNASRARCEELGQQYLMLWEECQKRRAELTQEQRTLAGQALALERYRQGVLARAPNSAAAAKRLERFRRRYAARVTAAERRLAAEQQALEGEATRLAERARRLGEEEEQLVARREELAQQQTEWEKQQEAAADAEERCRQEIRRLQAQQARDQVHLAELGDEVERIARLLMDEATPEEPAANQAA